MLSKVGATPTRSWHASTANDNRRPLHRYSQRDESGLSPACCQTSARGHLEPGMSVAGIRDDPVKAKRRALITARMLEKNRQAPSPRLVSARVPAEMSGASWMSLCRFLTELLPDLHARIPAATSGAERQTSLSLGDATAGDALTLEASEPRKHAKSNASGRRRSRERTSAEMMVAVVALPRNQRLAK
jgi:hypothetical protein